MKKIGYVLSGGGARGFAHLGILKLLEEINVTPYAIAGTSAGAVIGALYAYGKKPEEILSLMKDNISLGWSNIAWRKKGFFTMDALEKLLSNTIKVNDFDILKTKLYLATTDLIKGESVIFSTGKLFEVVIASATVPVIFAPVKFGNKLLVDGGILNNFPVEPLAKTCDVIIGSYVNKVEEGMTENAILETVNILDRCFHLAIANSVYAKVNTCDLFIETSLHAFDMYDVKEADKIFEIGYKTALQYKEKLIAVTKNDTQYV